MKLSFCRVLVTCTLQVQSNFLSLIKALTPSQVHQRGKRVAFLNIMSLGPINLSPILSGYVADRYNWRTNFWILTAFTAINLILVILFAPETQYERPSIYNTDIATTQPAQVEAALNPAKEEPKSPDLKNESATATAMEPNQEEPLTYWQELKPYSGLRMKENPWRHITQLFACATYPAVIWTFLVGGTYSGWVSLPSLSFSLSQPYYLNPLTKNTYLTKLPPPSPYTVQRPQHNHRPNLLRAPNILYPHPTRPPKYLPRPRRLPRLRRPQPPGRQHGQIRREAEQPHLRARIPPLSHRLWPLRRRAGPRALRMVRRHRRSYPFSRTKRSGSNQLGRCEFFIRHDHLHDRDAAIDLFRLPARRAPERQY